MKKLLLALVAVLVLVGCSSTPTKHVVIDKTMSSSKSGAIYYYIVIRAVSDGKIEDRNVSAHDFYTAEVGDTLEIACRYINNISNKTKRTPNQYDENYAPVERQH